MLHDRGITVADDLRAPSPMGRYVADRIALGVWCDALAWADRIDPLASWLALHGARARQAAELVEQAREGAFDFGEVGPLVVDTVPL